MIRNALQRSKNDPIVFSSEDSVNTDNSFNSSIDGENNDDYKNSFWHLKEQMQQFFLQNPGLQDQIKFEPQKFEEDTENEKKNVHHPPATNTSQNRPQTANSQNLQSGQGIKKPGNKKEPREKSKLWSAITKDIVRNGQFSSQVPTLETVNHRLNIFKKKLERVDYAEILQKETTKEKKPLEKEKKDENKKEEKKKDIDDDENQEEEMAENEEFQYYSFKKKMQRSLQQKMEKKKQDDDNQDPQLPKHRKNLVMRGEKQAKTYQGRAFTFTPGGQLIIAKQKSEKNLNNQDDKPKEETHQQNLVLDKDMEFQSKYGQLLYQTLKQYQNDVETFKKTAAFLLRDYKSKLYKQKNFPPQINKFTSDETKSLNILLPDFQNPLFQTNKQNLFQSIENYQLPDGTPESQFINTIDKILNGKVLQLWKEAQNNN